MDGVSYKNANLHLTALVIMWIGSIENGPWKWIIIGRTRLFSQWRKPHTHTHTRMHTRYKTMASSMNMEFFWALAWLVDCGFWATGQPKKNVTIGPLHHWCARCRARSTLKDVANWNYKTGFFLLLEERIF